MKRLTDLKTREAIDFLLKLTNTTANDLKVKMIGYSNSDSCCIGVYTDIRNITPEQELMMKNNTLGGSSFDMKHYDNPDITRVGFPYAPELFDDILPPNEKHDGHIKSMLDDIAKEAESFSDKDQMQFIAMSALIGSVMSMQILARTLPETNKLKPYLIRDLKGVCNALQLTMEDLLSANKVLFTEHPAFSTRPRRRRSNDDDDFDFPNPTKDYVN